MAIKLSKADILLARQLFSKVANLVRDAQSAQDKLSELLSTYGISDNCAVFDAAWNHSGVGFYEALAQDLCVAENQHETA